MVSKLRKTHPQFNELANFHLTILEHIVKRHPGWLGYATVETWKDEQFLSIYIPSPLSDRGLRIMTSSNRLTIGFDQWHGHAYPSIAGLSKAVQSTLETAHAFINERLVVVAYNNPAIVGQTKVHHFLSTEIYPPESINTFPQDKLVYTRSWNATYDHNYREL